MEEALLGEKGELLNRAAAIDMDLTDGFTMTLDELTVQEYAAFRMLRAQRARLQQRLSNTR